jgi:hypothetical protein
MGLQLNFDSNIKVFLCEDPAPPPPFISSLARALKPLSTSFFLDGEDLSGPQ